MSEEDLFAHILSGAEWTVEAVLLLKKCGYVVEIEEERYVVVKSFRYHFYTTQKNDIILTTPKTGIYPEVMVLQGGGDIVFKSETF